MSVSDHRAIDQRVQPRPGGLGLPGAALSGATTLVRLACGSFALILVAYVLCAVGQANPDHWLVLLVGQWSDSLNLGFDGLFQLENVDYRTIADFGVAALSWMFIGYAVSWFLRLLGGR